MANIPEIVATPLPTVSGKWKWNDTLPDVSSDIVQSVNFSYEKNNVESNAQSINIQMIDDRFSPMPFLQMNYGSDVIAYNGDAGGWYNTDVSQTSYDKSSVSFVQISKRQDGFSQ